MQKLLLLFIGSALWHMQAWAARSKEIGLWQSFEYTDSNRCYVRSGTEIPNSIISLLVAAHSQPGVNKNAVVTLLRESIVRKCPINAYDSAGLTPLHAAILFNDVEMVKFLLDNGADIHKTILRPNSPAEGMDASAFLAYLEKRNAENNIVINRSKVQALLNAKSKEKDK